MAGHSKWANIRYRKGAQDSKRGKIFTKLIREITVAAKTSCDPSSNARLRLAIDKALAHNMSRDTIDRAIKRGVGGGDETMLEEVRYEGYGPFGVAIFVDALTNNRNRTVSEVRHAFTKAGGNLGSDGTVSYLFTHKGRLLFPASCSEELLLEAAMDIDADDLCSLGDEGFEIMCASTHYLNVKTFLEKKGFKAEQAELLWIPSVQVSITEREEAQTVLKLLETLDDLDDVADVVSNVDIPDHLLELS
jgi:YebC/PmpR family DNA-binding regulatory protein